MDWFRFYSEAVSDRKLRRVARVTKQAPATVIGIWTIILCIASESPERGELLIGQETPATEEDIADVAGCDVAETLRQLEEIGLITRCGETLLVTAWVKRQYNSDGSTARVRKHRMQGQEREPAGVADDVTFPKRYCNVSETPPETETDTERELSTETEGADAPEALPVAAQAFVDNGGCWPDGKGAEAKRAEAIRAIAATVGDDPEDVRRWGQVVKAYCRQWSSLSYGTMLEDYFVRGRMPGESERRGKRQAMEVARVHRPPPGFVSVDGVIMVDHGAERV